MTRKPPPQGRPPFTSSKELNLVAWASLVLTVVGTVAFNVKAIANRDLLSVATTSLLLMAAVAVIVVLSRRHSPKEPPETEIFQPFGTLDIDSVWDRPTDTQRIVEAIHDHGDRLPLIVGPSGAGKTTLLKVMVEDAIPDDVAYLIIDDDYEGLRAALHRNIPDPDIGPKTVIVLDQFEQWLAYVDQQKNADVRKGEREWLNKTLRQAQNQTNCTVVISVRREWYYALRFLGDLVPPPAEACNIEDEEKDPQRAKNSAMREGMLDSFSRALKDKSLARETLDYLDAEDGLSPLEVQLVGALIEGRAKNGDPFDLEYLKKELGGVTGAIDAYFKQILDGAERPTLCMKILCGLSLKTRFREQTKLGDIRAGLYERDKAVANAAEYLDYYGLIVEHSGGTYELTHDFLAEWFNSKSGAELQPAERDTILAYVQAGGISNGLVLTPEERANAGRIRWGLVVVISLLLVMTLRLFYFGIDCHLVGPSFAHPIAGSLVDTTYILVLTPYAAWIIYIALFYDRVLICLKESRGARLFSIFIVANLIVSTLIGIVIPVAWLLGITTGGVAFAAKLIWLSRQPGLNRSAQRRLRNYGRITLFNLLFVGIAGVIAVYTGIQYVQTGAQLGLWLAIFYLAASALMTYWCLILTPFHVSRSGVSQLLGMIGRPNKVTLASSDT